jgi:hypothetical protein
VAAEQVVELVAENFEEAAEVTRSINLGAVRYFVGGAGLGAAIGFFIGYRYNREKIKAEAFKESEAEIEEIRHHYQSKMVADANETEKAGIILIDEGYVPSDEPVPIADLSTLRTESEIQDEERPLPAPVPITPRVYRHVDNEKDKMDGWNFPSELAKRSNTAPHIIHQDEFAQNETEYAQVTYVYYVEDDVLLDEQENILIDRDELVGARSLTRFGHGTDDRNILYVRNPILELEIEICRDEGSYEEKVLGLERESDNGGPD